ncbi:unnamed protein product [Schistocephalus solidus]|uniref:Uncharacterized protein n=1 Tax=Schistocephalus solidus TaxID=70667 RepID=A0A183T0R8_SCHSO|nr:unnamed protein product [Schistocephalus solidus]
MQWEQRINSYGNIDRLPVPRAPAAELATAHLPLPSISIPPPPPPQPGDNWFLAWNGLSAACLPLPPAVSQAMRAACLPHILLFRALSSPLSSGELSGWHVLPTAFPSCSTSPSLHRRHRTSRNHPVASRSCGGGGVTMSNASVD